MSSTDDQPASDDLVHRLAARMASADHGTLPADDADDAGEDAGGAVVDLTAGARDDGEDAEDLGDLVIDLDTYEAAHQLAAEEDGSR